MTFAIEAVALRKRYGGLGGGREALAGIDLQVPRGSGFGLIGLNGAGKTTFIKSLLSVVRPTSGHLRVLGGDPSDPAIRARIGYLPERLQLPHAWRATEFLASIARLKGLGRPGPEVERQLARVGLAGEAKRIGAFSKGMKQRLGLAAALLGGPELLILDEPTDGIDPLGRAEVRRLLSEELARGATVFLNSHLLSETVRICDRIGILAKGRLVREGSLDSLCGSGTRHRLRFAAGADRERLLDAGFLPSAEDGAWSCEAADPESLGARLDAARATGALLLELAPELRDLEDVLAEAVEAAA
ncbi:ABC transporter ATP-binding protein [Vulgatibacter incomptus]|uniref:Nitrous oxide reductase maturation protein NosF (ATPase) n=1 Tax=Vulgatibacter incomptus TaxID=1391653 RepID=A0A0K1PE73_9BACT|nr:ABC transporter ATP-binding protein [Vulgatibacter incomptus]AKU91838.1 Nitrous oxide reductase maturation protein NosF (ATPase) [Vulgatibacter incomptus]